MANPSLSYLIKFLDRSVAGSLRYQKSQSLSRIVSAPFILRSSSYRLFIPRLIVWNKRLLPMNVQKGGRERERETAPPQFLTNNNSVNVVVHAESTFHPLTVTMQLFELRDGDVRGRGVNYFSCLLHGSVTRILCTRSLRDDDFIISSSDSNETPFVSSIDLFFHVYDLAVSYRVSFLHSSGWNSKRVILKSRGR